MIQSAQVATARNARHINSAALRKIVQDERGTIYDEELHGWYGYEHDLEFEELHHTNELVGANVYQVNVWANKHGVGVPKFTDNNGDLLSRDQLNRRENHYYPEYDIGWDWDHKDWY